jgi:hypothetical protein
MQQQTIIVVLSPMLSLRGLQYHILHQCKKKVWKIQKKHEKDASAHRAGNFRFHGQGEACSSKPSS